jgi:hypothetical protein
MKVSDFFRKQISDKNAVRLEYFLIVITAVLPLFFNYPYRINLFLAWEGAYRMSIGQIPYQDFGSPVGYGFWLLPALFFKLFGPYVYTLLIVQAFINILSGILFKSFLKLFNVTPSARILPLLVFVLSYSMFNFWPWYNHFVFVVELGGLYLLCSQILKPSNSRSLLTIIFSGVVTAFAFMTKQDTGGLAFFISLAILVFDFIYERRFKTALIFVAGYAFSMMLFIVPFLYYDFLYWFNMGQFPHYARVDKFDLINEFLGASEFIKFYLVLILFLCIIKFNQGINWKENKTYILFTFISLLILGQAFIIQVTSYTPIDGNIYFHSFAIAFLVFHFTNQVNYSKLATLSALSLVICLWWSGVFWSRFLKEKVQKVLVDNSESKKNVISKRTYLMGSDSAATFKTSSRSKWIVSKVPSFKRIKIPQGTEDGIHQIMAMPEATRPNLKVLNMSELTSLAFDMGYDLESGPKYPLWFHKGVAFFDREVNDFCGRVSRKEYDIIMFEDIPNVNQFYSYEVRDCIKNNYTFKFKFLAPRVPEISYIEVYTKQ